MAKPRFRGARPVSVGDAAARPDERQILAFALHQTRVDRGRKRRIVELDREVVVALVRCLLPRRPELRSSGDDAVVRTLLVVAFGGDELHRLDVEGEGLDRAAVAVLGAGESADRSHVVVSFC